MNLTNFNETLRWLNKIELISFDDQCNLTLRATADGGPGENVIAYMVFKSVCYMNLSTDLTFSNFPMLVDCDIAESKKILPPEEFDSDFEHESKECNLTTIQIYDQNKPLSYCIVSYGFELRQEPINWNSN